MTNQPLKDQGLLSVKELWVNTCPRLEGTRMQGLSRHSFSEGGWCGEGELKAPLYPISCYSIFGVPLAACQTLPISMIRFLLSTL